MKRILLLVLIAASISGCGKYEAAENVELFFTNIGMTYEGLAIQHLEYERGYKTAVLSRYHQRQSAWQVAEYNAGLSLGTEACQTGRPMCKRCTSAPCRSACYSVIANRRRAVQSLREQNAHQQGQIDALRDMERIGFR